MNNIKDFGQHILAMTFGSQRRRIVLYSLFQPEDKIQDPRTLPQSLKKQHRVKRIKANMKEMTDGHQAQESHGI